jgi:hypothetical protein
MFWHAVLHESWRFVVFPQTHRRLRRWHSKAQVPRPPTDDPAIDPLGLGTGGDDHLQYELGEYLVQEDACWDAVVRLVLEVILEDVFCCNAELPCLVVRVKDARQCTVTLHLEVYVDCFGWSIARGRCHCCRELL